MKKAKLVILMMLLSAAVTGSDAVNRSYDREYVKQVWAENIKASSVNYQSAKDIRTKIYDYLCQDQNRRKVLKSALALNKGRTSNSCVYFVSETLRRNGVPIPKGAGNTKQLLAVLNKRGWKKESDFKKLQPGDVCFTTDFNGSKKGKPSHTFIFMGWVKPGNYDYAYICDNQIRDYKGNTYHIRNIKGRGKQNGYTKEAFSFFMAPNYK